MGRVKDLMQEICSEPMPELLAAFNDADAVLPRFGIDTDERLAHFAAQIAHETGGLRHWEEGLSYRSVSRIRAVHGSRAGTNPAALIRNPEALANQVYSNRYGNGPPASGDGFKFAGKGLFQLTFRNNYKNIGQILGLDLESHPELVIAPRHALAVAAAYWEWRNISAVATAGAVIAVTKRINGGTNGLADRRRYYKLAVAALKKIPRQESTEKTAEERLAVLERRLKVLETFLGAIQQPLAEAMEHHRAE